MIRCLLLAALLWAAVAGPAAAQADRSVLLVLDASGSMNAALPDGSLRIAAAKAAVADLVGTMAPTTRVALRAYGHQSDRRAKDCLDTALLSGFGPVAENGAAIVAQADGLAARGYTPITLALTRAAADLASEEAAERIVILVSDGQETCAADPCVAARALADADAKLVIHTIGFGVEAAARGQLQCIARMGRGTYYDAADAGALSAVLQQAVTAEATAPVVVEINRPAGPGILQIEPSWPGASFPVVDAETGTQVADINGATPTQELDPGLYNVQFVNGLWRGVEIRAEETTVLPVGLLDIEGGANDIAGYTLADPETDEIFVKGKVISTLPLMPGPLTLISGSMAWPPLQIRAGETTVLNPARITVSGDNAGTYAVTTADGRDAGTVSRLLQLPLPAGDYVADVEGQAVSIHLEDGQTYEIKVN